MSPTYDYHIHSRFSFDSKANPEDIIQAAVAQGLKGICFTDHEDIGMPVQYGAFQFDPEDYFKTLTPLKEKYQDVLDIKIGVELGLIPGMPEYHDSIQDFHDQYPWEYVIGSIHCIPCPTPQGIELIDPAHAEAFFSLGSTRRLFEVYYDCLLAAIKEYDCFDTVGHLDYPVRYIPKGFDPYRYEDHAEMLDEILIWTIQHDKALEINTGGLRKPCLTIHPEDAIIRRYQELGGTKFYYGSDAHFAKDVGCGLKDLIGKYENVDCK